MGSGAPILSVTLVLALPRPDVRARACCARTMTLSKEANEIRSEVQSLRKGPGRKYSKALRQRVVSWLKRALDEGMLETQCMEALGMPLQRLIAWRDEEQRIAAFVVPEPVIPRQTETTALVPVAMRDDELLPFGPMIAFSAPGGDPRCYARRGSARTNDTGGFDFGEESSCATEDLPDSSVQGRP